MELQQMRYVVAVAEERSFTRAAARCFVVQSALSHQVKALELELGAALFARTSRRVELTEAGARFLPAARAALQAAEHARHEVAAATGVLQGTLAIGLIPTVTALELPSVLRRFHQAHPAVQITMDIRSSADLESAIHEGSIDVGLLGLPEGREPRGVASRALLSEPLVAVLPHGHPHAGASALRSSDLADEVFADFRRGTPGREQTDLAFSAAGVTERTVAFEAPSPALLLALVREGLALCVLPPGVVEADTTARGGSDPGVVTVPLIDGPHRTQHLAWSAFNPRPAARAFVAMVCDAAA
ncbi:MAG: LysR family transcriptional regulator [Brachybacterium sp.]|nr:LysR family transcriptional regulator [Brachybacterium sp.]